MDKISKALEKLSTEEKKAIKALLLKIKSNNLENLDVKKLKGYKDIYRARKGKMRIIFKISGDEVNILALEKRSEKTYNF